MEFANHEEHLMEFTPTERSIEIKAAVVDFMDKHIYPVNKRYQDIAHSDRRNDPDASRPFFKTSASNCTARRPIVSTEGHNHRELLEFCLFLQRAASSRLSLVADQQGKARERHTAWTLRMIEGAILEFEGH